MPKFHYIFLLFLAVATASCSYTKHVPENERLLWDQDIRENGNAGARDGAAQILKQQPNQKLLGTMPNLWIYNLGDGRDSSFFSRIGEEPVVFDSVKAMRGAEQLRYFYFNKGYFGAAVDYEIELHEKHRWTEVTYRVETGPRFYLDTIETRVESKNLEGLVRYFSEETLLKKDDPYDADEMDRERERLTTIFKNHGYYDFKRSDISFKADTTLGNHGVHLIVIVSQKAQRTEDTVYYKDHEVHRYRSVVIQPDYRLMDKSKSEDSLKFRSYTIKYDTLQYKPRYLTDGVHFKPGDSYRQEDIRETYAHLVGYDAFQTTELRVVEAGRDSSGPLLNAYINLYPLKRFTILPQPELTTANGYGGVNMSLSFTWRNVFGAGEALNLKLSGGYDYQATAGNTTTASPATEVGAELSLTFPRFLLPFNTVGLLPKRMRPRSKISLLGSRTARFEFDRESYGGRLSYMWNESRLKSHTLDLYDVAFSKLFEINEGFQGNLTEFQRLSFRSELITATRYSFVYNGQLDEKIEHPSYFKGVLEIAGTSIYLGKQLAAEGPNTDGVLDSVAGVLYYQYIRPELDYRYFLDINSKVTWASRAYTGIIVPYGNSSVSDGSQSLLLPPFSKFFFMGGSNDLRAWPAYRLGPGRFPNTDYQRGRDTNFAIGTYKILLSTELRFPIYGYFEGAVFVDAGNTWLTGGLENAVPGTSFALNTFMREMAVGSGFGLRLNLSFFIIRFDIGVKLRDPGLLDRGDPWVIRDQGGYPKNWAYNIALGYPF